MVYNWIPFFSQTGNEIAEITELTKIEPLLIVTNKKTCDYDNRLKKYNILHFSDFNELRKLRNILDDSVVTLHGFLRIIPKELITKHMFNGHPGLISRYPELKGINPQEKAYDLNYKTSGCVIHKVEQEVDSGQILLEKEVIIENLSLENVYKELKKTSIELWVEFLERSMNENCDFRRTMCR